MFFSLFSKIEVIMLTTLFKIRFFARNIFTTVLLIFIFTGGGTFMWFSWPKEDQHFGFNRIVAIVAGVAFTFTGILMIPIEIKAWAESLRNAKNS